MNGQAAGVGCWELNLSPLGDWYALLKAEPPSS